MKYHNETIQIAEERAEDIKKQFIANVRYIISSGALPESEYSRSNVFRVAVEEIADGFRITNKKEYNNLKHF